MLPEIDVFHRLARCLTCFVQHFGRKYLYFFAEEAVVASKLYIYDKSSEIDREQAAGRFEGDDDVLTIGVSLGVMNLKKVFDQLLGSNQTFNRAVIQTHGGPGKIYLGNEFIDSNVWKGTFYGLNYEKLFPKFTRMYFDGCNVAEGGRGTDFPLYTRICNAVRIHAARRARRRSAVAFWTLRSKYSCSR